MNGIGTQLLIALFAAHVIGDFLLQNEKIAVNKHRTSILTLHAMGAGFAAYLACGLWRLWWIFAATAVSHWILDRLKLRMPRQRLRSFLADQAAHLIVVVVLSLTAAKVTYHAAVWPQLSGPGREFFLKTLLMAAGLLLAGKAGGILIELWVRPLLFGMNRENRKIAGEAAPAGNPTVGSKSFSPPCPRGLPNAGRIIGQMERLLIFMLVFAGEPGGIGFLVAAKSVFRFGELKEPSNRMEAEYILIGTLISFVYGIAVAYGTRFVWDLI